MYNEYFWTRCNVEQMKTTSVCSAYGAWLGHYCDCLCHTNSALSVVLLMYLTQHEFGQAELLYVLQMFIEISVCFFVVVDTATDDVDYLSRKRKVISDGQYWSSLFVYITAAIQGQWWFHAHFQWSKLVSSTAVLCVGKAVSFITMCCSTAVELQCRVSHVYKFWATKVSRHICSIITYIPEIWNVMYLRYIVCPHMCEFCSATF